MSEALIVIDVQNDFCPGGALGVEGGDQVVPILNRLQERFETIVLTQDWHPADHRSFASQHQAEPFSTTMMPYGEQVLWPDHCVQGSEGAAFHPGLDTNRAQLVIRKGFRSSIDSYSAFFENDRSTVTGLAGYLRERGIERIALAGIATDFCVAYSALDAVKLGFKVRVVEDASRAIDLDGSLAAQMAKMRGAGVTITRSDAL